MKSWKALLKEGITITDERSLAKLTQPLPRHLFICLNNGKGNYNRIQRLLINLYPSRYPVKIIRGIPETKRKRESKWCPLYKLNFLSTEKNTRFFYLPPLYHHNISELMIVMQKLRGKKGCPWDREQTHLSLRPYLIEEAYEVIEAINNDDMESLKEELGDLLLQVIFHAALARETGKFTFAGVVNTVTNKLIRRHPHVFGSKRLSTVKEVKEGWEEIKRKERKHDLHRQSSLLYVDPSLPALMKAYKLQGKASKAGFDWDSIEGPLEKIREELNELTDAYQQGIREKIEEELGDLLFAVVNVSRFMEVNPELALSGAIRKFSARFAYIEQKVSQEGGDFSAFNIEQLDKWWNEAKKKRKKS